MLFQADVAEAANARLPRMARLTCGMARSVVDEDHSRCCRLALKRIVIIYYFTAPGRSFSPLCLSVSLSILTISFELN